MRQGIYAFYFISCFILTACKFEPDVFPPAINVFTPSFGSPGTTVTIRGYSFGKNPTVFIGNISVPISEFTPGSSTEDQIVIIVPADAVTGKIKVKSENGITSSKTDFVVK